MKRYLITGNLNGLKYYLKLEEEKPELYSWRGIKEASTKFQTERDAHEILILIADTAKLKLSIETIIITED